jgi:NTP pyrophosphatase (non-canonical NTP hydrolase)
MQINRIAKKQFKWVERHNWHNKTNLEFLALIASEVGEAINECRMQNPTENFGSELADIILRVLDLSVVNKIDIQNEIKRKMRANTQRGTRGRIF